MLGGSPTRLIRLAPGVLGEDKRTLCVTEQVGTRLVDLGFAWPEPASALPVDSDLVSVVVPARCSPPVLEDLLSGLAGLDIVVVDDCSPTPLESSAAKYQARYVRLPRNLGPAEARNVGFKMTTNPYVVFCDSDTRAGVDDVLALVRHLAHEQVAAAAPRIVTAEVAEPTWLSRYESAASSLDMGSTSSIVRPGGRVPWVPSAVLAVHRDRVGHAPFDAEMRSGEDVDLVWRLVERNWLVYYDAEVVVPHLPRTRPFAWAHRKFIYGLSAAQLYLRHGNAVAPARLNWWSLGALFTLISGRPVLAGAALGARALNVRRKLRSRDLDASLRAELEVAAITNPVGHGRRMILGPWAPLLLTFRRGRRLLFVTAVIDAIHSWATKRPQLGIGTFAAARRIDDLAYTLGVWVGAARTRTLGPLLPTPKRFTEER